MKTQTRNFWGVEAVLEGGEKVLSYQDKKDGNLYFCIDGRKGKTPPPVLFSTKSEAKNILDKQPVYHTKRQDRKLKRLFTNIHEAKYSRVVPVKVLIN